MDVFLTAIIPLIALISGAVKAKGLRMQMIYFQKITHQC